MARSKDRDIIAHTELALKELGVTERSHVLVAASGGLDSTTLAFELIGLQKTGLFERLGIAHINHQLREIDADEDEEFVRAFAKAHDIPYYSKKVDVHTVAKEEKRSIEDAARVARYRALTAIASDNNFSIVVTAHHAGDVAETMLINLVRGAGLKGMAGIPPRRRLSDGIYVIRPWLQLTRREIEQWATSKQVAFRADTSNLTDIFLRNRIRHSVLPVLREAFGERDILKGIGRSVANIYEADKYLQQVSRRLIRTHRRPIPPRFVARQGIAFDMQILQISGIVFREVCRIVLQKLTGHYVSLTKKLSNELNAFREQPDKRGFLFENISVYPENGFLVFERLSPSRDFRMSLEIGTSIRTDVGELTVEQSGKTEILGTPNVAVFDYESIKGRQLMVRPWAHGDRLKPFGMGGHSRLVSDLLNEAGVKSERLKHFVPLVVFQDDPQMVLWIPGVRAAEFGRVNATTETVLILRRTPVYTNEEP